MAPTRAQLLATAHRFLEGYNTWTIKAILSIRSPNCIHHVPPKSFSGSASYNNTEFAAFLKNVIPLFHNMRSEAVGGEEGKSFIVDVDRWKVVMHLRGYADSDIGPYENEYIFMLRMTESGDLVEEIVEFLDSGYAEAFFGKLQSRNENMAKD
ncbi:hypothetical protein B7463_g4851, partial [Scytalidium lignicola]